MSMPDLLEHGEQRASFLSPPPPPKKVVLAPGAKAGGGQRAGSNSFFPNCYHLLAHIACFLAQVLDPRSCVRAGAL